MLAALLALNVGCGGNSGAIMPEGELTPEQIAEVEAEDQSIMDEELGGGVAPVKKKKK